MKLMKVERRHTAKLTRKPQKGSWVKQTCVDTFGSFNGQQRSKELPSLQDLLQSRPL